MSFLPHASRAHCIVPACTGLGSLCGEYTVKYLFMQLSKREKCINTACLPFHIGETRLVSARISLLLVPHGLEV
jgi:hypothetical protein